MVDGLPTDIFGELLRWSDLKDENGDVIGKTGKTDGARVMVTVRTDLGKPEWWIYVPTGSMSFRLESDGPTYSEAYDSFVYGLRCTVETARKLLVE